MRKEDVITLIAEKTGVNKKTVTDVVENFFVVVKDSMAEGNNIYIRGFGSFINQKRARKIGRDISKNKSIVIEEHVIPKFKPADIFVEKIKKSTAVGETVEKKD